MMVDASLLIPGETRIRDDDGFCGTVVYVGKMLIEDFTCARP
jgi:hypothetical protein